MLENYLKDLEEVVNIDCGSGTCAGVTRVAEIMKRRYEDIGFSAHLVDLGDKAGRGLFATNKPGAERFDIMFNAHLDTVYPEGTVAERPFRVENGTVYGPAVPTARRASSASITRSRTPAGKISIVSRSPSAAIPTKR